MVNQNLTPILKTFKSVWKDFTEFKADAPVLVPDLGNFKINVFIPDIEAYLFQNILALYEKRIVGFDNVEEFKNVFYTIWLSCVPTIYTQLSYLTLEYFEAVATPEGRGESSDAWLSMDTTSNRGEADTTAPFNDNTFGEKPSANDKYRDKSFSAGISLTNHKRGVNSINLLSNIRKLMSEDLRFPILIFIGQFNRLFLNTFGGSYNGYKY